jgi:hypothetical protein
VLLTDIDHLVPEKTWIKILTASLNPRQVYKFGRVSEPDLAPYKPHPNTWLMTRETYDRAGGYDERLAGWYGTDGDFRNGAKGRAGGELQRADRARAARGDARRLDDDAGAPIARERGRPRSSQSERAKIKGWRPLRGQFPWVQVL